MRDWQCGPDAPAYKKGEIVKHEGGLFQARHDVRAGGGTNSPGFSEYWIRLATPSPAAQDASQNDYTAPKTIIAAQDGTAKGLEADDVAPWAISAERAASDEYAMYMGDPDGNDDTATARIAAARVIEMYAIAALTDHATAARQLAERDAELAEIAQARDFWKSEATAHRADLDLAWRMIGEKERDRSAAEADAARGRGLLEEIVKRSYVGKPGRPVMRSKYVHFDAALYHRAVALAQTQRRA